MRSLPKMFPEFIQLMGIRLWVELRNAVEFFRVAFRYYPNKQFFKIDFAIFCSYFFQNPFKISKKFLEERHEQEIDVYGETPLTAMDQIARVCDIKASDIVIELGCGRGRACFWLHEFIQCKVIGIEYIPIFVERANKIKEKFQLSDIEFICEDILQADLSLGTVLYLYGSTYEDEFLIKLVERIEKLDSGTKIISVSYPLSDYTSNKTFNLIKVFPVQFTWGEADVYLQVRI